MKKLWIFSVLAAMFLAGNAFAALAQVTDGQEQVPIKPPIKVEIVKNCDWDISQMGPDQLPVPAKIGQPYSLLIAAKGGGFSGYIWTVKGMPPEGLSVSSADEGTIQIMGTPMQIGTYTTTITATDKAYEHVKGEITLTIKVVSQ